MAKSQFIEIPDLDSIPDIEGWAQQQANIRAQQEGLSKEEVMQQMAESSETAVDLDNLPKPDHNWIDRGLKMSCEGANHPNHSHYKVSR